MYIKLRQAIFVLVMGLLLPGAVMGILSSRQEPVTEEKYSAEQAQLAQILVLKADGTSEVMEMEEYVLCVVLAEMPADFEMEALKAQAVLARTYALKRSQSAQKHPNGAVCTESSCCQGFCPVAEYQSDESALTKVQTAVLATKGQVLTYEGQLIEATYFSCSGGRTEDALAVWGTDVPYLQATDSPGEENTKHYTTTVYLERQECAQKLGVDADALAVSDVTYTDGGGVDLLSIGGKSFTGVQLRQLLGLKSTAFRMTVVGNRVIITVKGYGHRVGMSQYGADAMAVSGSSYEQILAHYYQGTTLEKDFP